MTTDKPQKRCATCRYWQNYEDRVWANLSVMSNYPHGRGLELRRCRYSPPPGVDLAHHPVKYTDEDFTCSAWEAP